MNGQIPAVRAEGKEAVIPFYRTKNVDVLTGFSFYDLEMLFFLHSGGQVAAIRAERIGSFQGEFLHWLPCGQLRMHMVAVILISQKIFSLEKNKIIMHIT